MNAFSFNGRKGSTWRVQYISPYSGFDTVDERYPAPVDSKIGSLTHYLQGFLHPRWCRISSLNSIKLVPKCASLPSRNANVSSPFFQFQAFL